MPEVICDTSPLQYLHQLQLLSLLPALVGSVTVPPAVVEELNAGRALGTDLPDLQALQWVTVRSPVSRKAVPLVHDLGPGETEVLLLGLESADTVLILDDGLARRVAESLQLRFTGTLGILLDAKRVGLLPSVRTALDRLDGLRFRIAPATRALILETAGE